MAKLDTDCRFAQPDDVYQSLVDLHRGLTDDQCRLVDAKLILLLANHIGDAGVLSEALALARRGLNGQSPAA